MANLGVKDYTGATKYVKTDGAGSDPDPHVPHHVVDDLPGVAAEGGALPAVYFVMAGDDGTDAHPIQVDASGFLKVVQQANDGVDIGDVDVATIPATAAEGAALPALYMVVAGDDGVDVHPLQLDADGFLKVVLKANDGVDIGDVDVASLPGTTEADIAAIKAAVEVLDNIVAGSEAQVDVVSLPGTVAADIGAIKTAVETLDNIVNLSDNADVDVASLPGDVETDIAAIKAAVEVLDNIVAGSEAQVDVVSLPGTVAADIAAIKTAVEVLDNIVAGAEAQVDVVSLPGTVETDIAAIKTAVEVLDNIVAGSEAQVDVVTLPATAAEAAALPSEFVVVAGDDGTDTHPLQVDADGYLKAILQTGAAAIGKLAANAGVNIGTVDVATIPATAGEGSGLPTLFVVVAGDDGVDTHPIQLDADGNLKTNLNAGPVAAEGGALPSTFLVVAGDDGVDTHPIQVDGDGYLKVNVVAGSAAATEYTEGDTDATLTGMMAMAEGPADTVTPLAVDASGFLKVNVSAGSAAATEYTEGDTDASLTGVAAMAEGPGDTVAPLQVDASGNLQTDVVGALPAGDNNIGDVDVASLPGTTEADIAAIKAAVEILDNIVAGSEAQVDVVSLPGTVETDIAAIKTAVEVLDNIVAGSEAQVDVVTLPATAAEAAALPSEFVVVAGDDGTDTHPLQTDAAGALKTVAQANDGVDIGDVDVASLPGTTEADIAAIKAAVEILDNIVAGSEAQVDVVSLPGTVETDIAAIKTAVEVLDNIVAGSEAQVDVVSLPATAAEAAALPSEFVVVAGDDGTDTHPLQTDAAGALKTVAQANDGVDIGDVDVASLPGTTEADIAAIKAAVEVLDNIVAGSEAQVDVASLPGTVETDIAAIKTAVEVLDNAISGTTMRAAIVSSVGMAGEGSGLPTEFAVVAGDDGVDTHPLQLDAAGSLKTVAQAGEAHMGQVGGHTVIVEAALSLDTAPYADGDVLADTQEAASALRVDGGSGIIQSITLLDKDDQGQPLDIVFLRSNVSLGTENAAVSISDADAEEILGIVKVHSFEYDDLVNSYVATKKNIGLPVAVGSGTSLWVGVISRGTGTYTASGIVLKIGILQD